MRSCPCSLTYPPAPLKLTDTDHSFSRLGAGTPALGAATTHRTIEDGPGWLWAERPTLPGRPWASHLQAGQAGKQCVRVRVSVRMGVCACVHVCVHEGGCVCVHEGGSMRVSMRMGVCACVRVRVHEGGCMRVCACVSVRMVYARMYVCVSMRVGVCACP